MYPNVPSQPLRNCEPFPMYSPMFPPPHYLPYFHSNHSFQNDQYFQRLQEEKHTEFIVNQIQHQLQQQNFPEVYKMIQNNIFPAKYHNYLQELWFNAHYEEAKTMRNLKLTPVTKYRIRKKHPLPRSIWDGEETSYCFKERSRQLLKDAFAKSPYPNASEKKLLAQQTELNKDQICNWFKNRRQRNRNLKLKGSSDDSNRKSEETNESISENDHNLSMVSQDEKLQQHYSTPEMNFHEQTKTSIDHSLPYNVYPYSPALSHQLMGWPINYYEMPFMNYTNPIQFAPQDYLNSPH